MTPEEEIEAIAKSWQESAEKYAQKEAVKEKEEKPVEKDLAPEVKKAIDEMQELRKSFEMRELVDIAKKTRYSIRAK